MGCRRNGQRSGKPQHSGTGDNVPWWIKQGTRWTLFVTETLCTLPWHWTRSTCAAPWLRCSPSWSTRCARRMWFSTSWWVTGMLSCGHLYTPLSRSWGLGCTISTSLWWITESRHPWDQPLSILWTMQEATWQTFWSLASEESSTSTQI